MTTIKQVLLRWNLLCVLWLSACTPMSDKERDFTEQKQREQAESEALKLNITEGALDTDVIRMVKESPATEGHMDTATWVDQQMAQTGGQAIFPRWEVSRRSATKYETRYTFTMLDDDDVTKRGWKWDVDVSLKVVSAPRQIMAQDHTQRPRSTDMQQRRVILEEASLE